jgi:hypothetical protein
MASRTAGSPTTRTQCQMLFQRHVCEHLAQTAALGQTVHTACRAPQAARALATDPQSPGRQSLPRAGSRLLRQDKVPRMLLILMRSLASDMGCRCCSPTPNPSWQSLPGNRMPLEHSTHGNSSPLMNYAIASLRVLVRKQAYELHKLHGKVRPGAQTPIHGFGAVLRKLQHMARQAMQLLIHGFGGPRELQNPYQARRSLHLEANR